MAPQLGLCMTTELHLDCNTTHVWEVCLVYLQHPQMVRRVRCNTNYAQEARSVVKALAKLQCMESQEWFQCRMCNGLTSSYHVKQVHRLSFVLLECLLTLSSLLNGSLACDGHELPRQMQGCPVCMLKGVLCNHLCMQADKHGIKL